jgi:hypothetical protein
VRLRVDLAASVPKDGERPELNEDIWAHEPGLTCFALSDGASESYDSKRWARLLVQKYAADPHFLPAWVDAAVSDYNGSVDFDALSWSQQAAFERGSFATLLGLQLAENRREIEVLAVGDSLACHIRNGVLLASYPYTTPEEFDARPALLSTIGSGNTFLRDPEFFARNTSKTWVVEAGDVVLLVTDAMGQWLLREMSVDAGSLVTLAAVTSESELGELTARLRAEHRMRVDDTTLLRLVVEND